ncbi:hypothetical protein GGS23DRAFT_595951 [Durotheca rogersii]|uniref:uncharacterized protein n=1 Tax=Durotheca rogersii TaxID=419775 RepID=UPI00221F2475|nr:uncharacterized protein GGS23DRAFT_595951 [Durotheca rogersii]KAI5864318.1 hypothetical protein GGS23DRAFT_595951 [Durotheca rogersii]
MSSKGHAVLTAGAVLVSTTGVAISSRVAARWLHKTMGWDDVLILVGFVFSVAMCTCVMVATRFGLGVDRHLVGDEDYDIYLKLQIASSVTYSWGVQIAKASFAVLYLRIFPEGSFRIVNKILIGFLLCQSIEETFVTLFKCIPIEKSWNFRMEGTCLDLHPLWYSTFVFNMISDLILFLEPIPSTWKLQLPLVKRLGLIAMLSLGLLVTAIAVIRIVYVTAIGSNDTYELADPLIWSMTEICALIICSCIPSLRQVAAKIPGLNSALGLSSGGGSKTYYGHSGGKNTSIPLQNRGRKEYIQSQKTKNQIRGTGFGMTSRATAVPMDALSENGSQDEIFPHKSDQNGVIMVTTELQHHVESQAESATTFTDASSQHNVEPRNST